MTQNHEVEPPAVSPDGRFWWDGGAWVPFVGVPVAPSRPRSPFLAVVFTLLLAGAGHWYAGKVAAGFAMLGLAVLTNWITMLLLTSGTVETLVDIALVLGLAVSVCVFIATDAYRAVKGWNAERGLTY